MGASQMQTIIRGIAVLLLLLATICVGLGRNVCLSPSVCSVFRVNIDLWNYGWEGQWFVFISSIFMVMLCIGLIVVGIAANNRSLSTALSGTVVLLTFICFCMEAWYADIKGGAGYIESYVAATVFYALVVIVMIGDLVLTSRSHA